MLGGKLKKDKNKIKKNNNKRGGWWVGEEEGKRGKGVGRPHQAPLGQAHCHRPSPSPCRLVTSFISLLSTWFYIYITWLYIFHSISNIYWRIIYNIYYYYVPRPPILEWGKRIFLSYIHIIVIIHEYILKNTYPHF